MGAAPTTNRLAELYAHPLSMVVDPARSPSTASPAEVLHTRRVVFPHDEYWVVHDHVRGRDRSNRYVARWHLRDESPGKVRVVRNSKHTTIITPAGRIVVPTSVEVEVERDAVVVLRPVDGSTDIVTVLSPGRAGVTMVDQTRDGFLHCSILRGSTTDLIRWGPDTDISWERWSA